MKAVLTLPNGNTLTLELLHWDNEMVGEWLHKIMLSLTNYPKDKRPQMPMHFRLELF